MAAALCLAALGLHAIDAAAAAPKPNAARAARIAAFAAGPLVAAAPWRAGEAVTVDTVRRLVSGQHIVYTAAGTTGTTEPVINATTPDGRPIADGTATAYANGRLLKASVAGAPKVGSAANAQAAGLVETDFAMGDFKPPQLSAVQGCMSISTGTAFIGHYCFANGPATGSGNATAIASGKYGAGLANAFVYHANSWEEEFVVTDRNFGLVFGNSATPVNVEIDGAQVQAGPIRSSGAEGWTLTFDYGNVVKRRTIRVVSAVGSVAPTLRGVALSPQGKVEAGTTSKDQVLFIGDSINATVTPPTEAGTQMLSYWVQRYLGFGGAINMAVGGSGYISQNPDSFNVPHLLANPANQTLIAAYAPNISHVIVGAGFNDRQQPLATVQAAALQSWKALRTLLPNAKITVIDGWSGSSGPDANAIALAAGLTQTFAAWGDRNARMVHPVGASAATAYVSGTGYAAQPVVPGNSSVYISTDAVHPSPAGARYIARRLSDDISSAWAGAY
jgi:lysophospholipase L1-like esterase